MKKFFLSKSEKIENFLKIEKKREWGKKRKKRKNRERAMNAPIPIECIDIYICSLHIRDYMSDSHEKLNFVSRACASASGYVLSFSLIKCCICIFSAGGDFNINILIEKTYV